MTSTRQIALRRGEPTYYGRACSRHKKLDGLRRTVSGHCPKCHHNHIRARRDDNRSEQMGERKAALERWTAHVEGLVSDKPVKVLTLRKGRQ